MRDNSHWHPDARRTVLAALVLTGLLTALSGCGEGANGARVSGLDATATLDAGRGTTAPASSTPGTALTSWWLRKTTARSGAKQPRGSWRPEGRR